MIIHSIPWDFLKRKTGIRENSAIGIASFSLGRYNNKVWSYPADIGQIDTCQEKGLEIPMEEIAMDFEEREVTTYRWRNNSRVIKQFCLFCSIAMLIAAPIGAAVTGEWGSVFQNFIRILTSPCPLVTDYYQLGGFGSAMLNGGLCGLAIALIVIFVRGKATGTTIAGYFLVIAHCFYGLNLLNMWPCFFGVLLYCKVMKKDIGENLHFAMFATSMGPLVSELLFRYTLGDAFVFGVAHVTWQGVLLTVILSVVIGFLVPAMVPGTGKMHKSLNLYKAGLGIGLTGMFIFALLYKTFGVTAPSATVVENALYEAHGNSYMGPANVFFISVFVLCILWGYLLNNRSFRGYGALFRCSGYNMDLTETFGMPIVLINIGLYGLFILTYMDVIVLFTEGVGFTGPTTGVVIAAITFSAIGQHPRNVWPIIAGYVLLFAVVRAVCTIAGIEALWSLSMQGNINGLAFATGLCPIASKYGRRYGVAAGFLDAILCTSTSAMHGGFVLYNGGLTAGLTALLLVPILEHYQVQEIDEF